MTTPKVVITTTSCGTCPNYSYYSGGVYRCSLVDEAVLEKNRIAPFCPLPDYPSSIIADMQVTMLGLQKSVDYSFPFALFTFIAAKLKRTVSANGSTIVIPVRDREPVRLRFDSILELKTLPLSIRFEDRNKIYVLYADGINGPHMSEVLRRESVEQELFHRLDLAA